MKTLKLALAVAASTLLAASASAQVNINISGAVAFRDVAYRVITNLYGAQLASINADTPANQPASIRITFTGQITNLFSTQLVTIKANYNGAVAGIQDLVQNRNVSYFSSSSPGVTNLVNEQSDLAFGSVFQASTAFTSPVLTDSKFGVTPVFFVKSSSAPAGLTNITTQQFRVLAQNGKVPGWYLTGNTNDTADIYYISRDPTAGQRVIVQKENKYSGSVISYSWSGTVFTNDAIGRTSTQIASQLNSSGPAVSFLTAVDAISVNGGANVLAHNGWKPFTNTVLSSVANAHLPVINGQYTQWGYEHVLNRSGAGANVISFRNALLTKIDTDLLTSAYSLPTSKLLVERTGEGSTVTPK
jgi:hypothetical protein